MEFIITISIVCVSVIIITLIVTKTFHKFYLSRTHLHSFNRRCEAILKQERIEFGKTKKEMEKKINTLEHKIDSVLMKL